MGKRKKGNFKAKDMVVIQLCVEHKGNKKYKVESENSGMKTKFFFLSLGNRIKKEAVTEV